VNTIKTLREIIERRQQVSRDLRCGVTDSWWDGHYSGQHRAYQELIEILEQHGFDLDVVVIK
jgi:hypothetical protein